MTPKGGRDKYPFRSVENKYLIWPSLYQNSSLVALTYLLMGKTGFGKFLTF